MKKIIKTFKVKLDYSKIPNPMHLNIQQTYKAKLHVPKKGKGSFNRQKSKKIDQDY